ncbi:RHS repeat domain-containing protein [Flavobacterium eburneipallidum]|uniref:RHS repeat domain-containing protein n=1 Tax=Flavobacterium eburneipallidum TaxID=3003263 RepID=UPI002482DC0B|nr:RHS repeat domain-containing protein [Flavobacterium eburneipallidum]
MKNKITLLLFITTIIHLYSQQNNNNYSTTKVIPPSPTAAALGAYGDIPIGYFTGQPNINIPIYQIKTNQHQLDISLSYNSNVRVNQDASWVGLGWSLNAGGVITRTIRGLDDFSVFGSKGGEGYYNAAALLVPDELPEDEPFDQEIYKNLSFNTRKDNGKLLDPVAQYFFKAKDGQIDLEPDIFNYNFAGYSGSFVLGKKAQGSVVYKKKEDGLKIEVISTEDGIDGNPKWKITTPEGYVYYFGTAERTENLYTNNINLPEDKLKGLGPYMGIDDGDPSTAFLRLYAFKRTENYPISSWYLDYIEAPNTERISFNYVKHGKVYSNINISQTRYDIADRYTRISTQDVIYEDGQGNITCVDEGVSFDDTYRYTNASKQIIDEITLESIVFNGGKIDFVSNFNTDKRKDIEAYNNGYGGRKLSQIQIFNSNYSVKTFSLIHDYFNSTTQNTTNGSQNRYNYCRLKLESITEVGKSPYKFEYYNSESMPSKYTTQVDKWGYYNPGIIEKKIGDFYYQNPSHSMSTLIPEVTYNGTIFQGVKRVPDNSGLYSRCGIIQKITYPTGGWTIFNFEPNQRKTNEIELIENIETIASTLNEGELNTNVDVYESNFSVSSAKTYDISLQAEPAAFSTAELPIVSDVEPIAWLKNSSGTIIETFYLTNPIQTLVRGTRNFAAGNYKLVVSPIYDLFIRLVVINRTTTSSPITKETIGGLRISKTENFDFTGTKLISKKYIYTEDGTLGGESTGFSISESKDYQIKDLYKNRFMTCQVGLEVNYWDFGAAGIYMYRTSNSLHTQGFNSLSGVTAYNKVFELVEENGNLGKTSYEFRSIRDFVSYNTDPIIGGLNLGDVTRIRHYNSQGSLVQQTDTSFKTIKKEYLFGINMDNVVSKFDPCPTCFLDKLNGDRITYSVNWSEWYEVDKVTKTDYTENGGVIVSVDSLNYDNPYHKKVTSKIAKTSDGKWLRTNYKYPHDFATTAPYNEMITKNIISPVIETTTYKDTNKDGVSSTNELLNTERTDYKKWSNDLILPELVQTSKGVAPLETRMEYISYYPNGNIKEVTQKDGSHTFFIWGYNNQYPVAKVENATESQINALNLNMSIINSTTTSEASKRLELEKIKDGLLQALVSVYTYDPLIGMTSMTDPKGYTTYYVYDSENRLKHIKDADGKIISSNQYHYRK